MSSRPDALAERRRALIARCAEEREELGAIVGGIESKLALAETVVATARGLNRHRALAGAAGVFMVLAPLAARSWIRRALWLIPAAIEGYRLFAGHRRSPPDDPSPQAESTG
jgi:hypothetical protein